ncbi:MAG: long-chain fatty acid--CoA ligase [Deltaproteobacteria bacterium]|nr:long-chain fatty acid--CoA ligase [Deltaproteobacteria bacterium]
MFIGDWIRKWSDLFPRKTAVIEGEKRFSYVDINKNCNKIANYLLSKSVSKGDRVAVLSYNTHKFLEIYFAANKIGALFVPLNWRMAAEEITGILDDCQPRVLFFAEEFADTVSLLKDRIEGLDFFISLGSEGSEWSAVNSQIHAISDEEPLVSEKDPEDPHIIMYTSGTTGAPKGVILSNRKTFFNVLNANIFFKLTPNDVFLVSRPLFHSGGLLVNSSPVFYKGGTVILKRRFSTREYLEAIEKYHVTIAEPAATFLNFVLQEQRIEDHDLSSLKCIFTGGERVGLNLLREYHERKIPLSQLFGMTETSTLTWLPTEDAFLKAGSVGKSVFHGDLRVVNKEGRDVLPGENGEILVKGPILMSGYWNRPEKTAEVMENGWFHTGDLATKDDEGFLYIIDRIKDTYISGGENIHPAEIEKVLLTNPKIFDVAVYGVPDEKWGESGKASIIVKENQVMTPEEIVEFLHGKIGKFKIPKHFEFVDTLPRTASGKIKRHVLAKKHIDTMNNS